MTMQSQSLYFVMKMLMLQSAYPAVSKPSPAAVPSFSSAVTSTNIHADITTAAVIDGHAFRDGDGGIHSSGIGKGDDGCEGESGCDFRSSSCRSPESGAAVVLEVAESEVGPGLPIANDAKLSQRRQQVLFADPYRHTKA
jgi:hypothetical protein